LTTHTDSSLPVFFLVQNPIESQYSPFSQVGDEESADQIEKSDELKHNAYENFFA
jgi:hypothetical protein